MGWFLICLGVFVLYWVLYSVYWNMVSPRFDRKTFLITGASSGIGEEMTKQLCKLGAQKIVMCARRVDELERVKSECRKAGTST